MSTTPKKQPVVFGKYLLLDRINIGGMAEVWRGKTFGAGGFERLVAIKRILPNIAEDDEFKAMFIDEAKISVRLTHANIAQVHDLGQIGNSLFIAMEYIPGKDLRSIFDRSRKKGEPAPIPLTCYVISKLCDALDYAHRKKDEAGRDMNIVHRDVSPQNVLISFDGDVKVIDFGIAKAAGKATKTQAGILKGKFGYMSPEQIRGLPLDRRSDVFAIGVCLYEMLTGERLFVGDSDFSVLEKVRRAEVLAPSTYNRRVPDGLERVVLKALAKDVEVRYQYASELFKDLQPFVMTPEVFTQRDLAQYMKSTFVEDVDREKARALEYADVKLPAPVSQPIETPTHPQSLEIALVAGPDVPTPSDPGPLANIVPTSSQSRALTQVASSLAPPVPGKPPELPRRVSGNGFPKLTPMHVGPASQERDIATQLVATPVAASTSGEVRRVDTDPTWRKGGAFDPTAIRPQSPSPTLGNAPFAPTMPATPSTMPPAANRMAGATATALEMETPASGTAPLLAAVPAGPALLDRPAVDVSRVPSRTPPPRRNSSMVMQLPSGMRLVAAAAIGFLLVLSGVVVGYMMRAGARGFLLIELTPAIGGKARLAINGRDQGVPDSWPVLREVAPGNVGVKITADGYKAYAQTVLVSDGKSPTPLRVDLLPSRELTQLVVVTDPETAELRVGDRIVKKEGNGGFRSISVTVGVEQYIRASRRGFRPVERRVLPTRSDEPTVVFLKLESGEFSVNVNSRPEGAQLFFGDRLLGVTPTRLRITPDIVSVTLKRKCHEPYELVLTPPLEPSDVPKLDVELVRQPGCS